MPRSLAKWFKVPSGSTPSGNAAPGEHPRDRMHAAVAAADDDGVDRPGARAPGRPHRGVAEPVAGHECDLRRHAARRERRGELALQLFPMLPIGGAGGRVDERHDPQPGCRGLRRRKYGFDAGAHSIRGLAVCGASTLMSRRCHVQEKLCRAAPAQKGFQVGSPVNLR